MDKSVIIANQISWQKKIKERLLELGYPDVASLVKRSGLGSAIVFETARRTFYDDKKPVHPLSLGVVMRFLDYSVDEIRQAVTDLGGSGYALLIGGSDQQLATWEEGMLSAARQIVRQHPRGLEHLSAFLTALSDAYGIDCDEDLQKLKRGKVPKLRKAKPGLEVLSAGKIQKGTTRRVLLED
jgi:hypothetical protein